MKASAVALIPTAGGFVALECAKGRGIILPGGKCEQGELYSETAVRETLEETGIIVRPKKLIFHAPDFCGFHCFTWLCQIMDASGKQDSGEGKVIVANWKELMTGHFRAYYECLRGAYENR
jgi:8-oxo-dGTP pyrophosphatase MutT (NUDIX family)